MFGCFGYDFYSGCDEILLIILQYMLGFGRCFGITKRGFVMRNVLFSVVVFVILLSGGFGAVVFGQGLEGEGAFAFGPADVAGDHTVFVRFDGKKRKVIVHIPPSYDQHQDVVPLVFMFHGGGGSAKQAARAYHWKEESDQGGFIVMFPEGTGFIRTWKSVHCCGSALKHDVDDVGFVRMLIQQAGAQLRIDEKRIYATGMSNGGMFSHLLGSVMSDVFAAVAPVAGTIGGQVDSNSEEQRIGPPIQPIPIMMFHGQLDTNVQYFGGKSKGGFNTGRIDLSQEECVQFWVSENGTVKKPIVEVSDSGNIITRTFEDPDQGRNADVVHVTVVDQGHAWPGGKFNGIGDPPTQEISATELIWEFFQAHPRK